MGPNEILIVVWKCLGDIGVGWLVNIFNEILSLNKMSNEWISTLILII
jgi:hypothetical protein